MYVYTRVYVCGFVMQVNIRLPMVTFFFSISLSLSPLSVLDYSTLWQFDINFSSYQY